MEADTFSGSYKHLLRSIYRDGEIEVNARTNTAIKMLAGGTSFKIDLAEGKLPVAGNRTYWPHIAAAEVAWQFMGTKDPTFILKHAPKLWSKFVEDGELKTAYGFRWSHAFGRDQLRMAVETLRNDPTNRQVFISAWDPRVDGLGAPDPPKNIPCPVGFTLSRTGNRVHMSVLMRSSDVYVGLPYDVMAYTLTLDAICASIGCLPGTLHFTLAHPHVYKPHWDMMRANVGEPWLSSEWNESKKHGNHQDDWAVHTCEPALPAFSIEGILQDPDGYVSHVKRLAARTVQHPWNPMPPVVE